MSGSYQRSCEVDRSTIPTSAIVGSFLPSENPLPVVLHADDEPTLRLGFVVQCLSEGADLGIRQSLGRAVGIIALCVIVQHNHHQGCSAAPPGCTPASAGRQLSCQTPPWSGGR